MDDVHGKDINLMRTTVKVPGQKPQTRASRSASQSESTNGMTSSTCTNSSAPQQQQQPFTYLSPLGVYTASRLRRFHCCQPAYIVCSACCREWPYRLYLLMCFVTWVLSYGAIHKMLYHVYIVLHVFVRYMHNVKCVYVYTSSISLTMSVW